MANLRTRPFGHPYMNAGARLLASVGSPARAEWEPGPRPSRPTCLVLDLPASLPKLLGQHDVSLLRVARTAPGAVPTCG